jgi:peroxiredoxin
MKSIINTFLLFFFFAMSLNSVAQNNGLPPSSPNDLKDGAKAPNVILQDTLMQNISIKSFRGKYVFVDVWNSRCEPCYNQIPYLKALERQMEGENIVFLSICSDTYEFRWKGMRNMYPGLQLWDKDGSFCKKYNVIYSPRCILIDPKGKIIKAFLSQPSKPETLEFLKKIFNRK